MKQRFQANGKNRLCGLLLLVVLFGMIPVALQAQAPPQSQAFPPPDPRFQIPASQTLVYDVDWRVFPAGTATFHLKSDGAREHVSATATSLGTFHLLFPVDDQYDSVFDRLTGCSYEYRQQVQEGRRRVKRRMTLDYSRGQQELSEDNLVSGTSKVKNSPIPACVTDVLSGMFYVATQPLEIGHDLRFPLADGGHVISVSVKVEAKEKVKTPAGTFSTIRVQPTAAAGVVKNRGTISIWYSDDARHLPVQVRAHLFWGTITMRLTKVSDQ